MKNSVFLQKFGTEALKSVKSSPHPSLGRNSTWKPSSLHQVRNWARPFSRMLSINIFRFELAFRTNYWYWGREIGVLDKNPDQNYHALINIERWKSKWILLIFENLQIVLAKDCWLRLFPLNLGSFLAQTFPQHWVGPAPPGSYRCH